jgi:antitoxin VapB
MALNIKHPHADRLARELAEVTGESLTEAVIVALRERLERQRGRRTDRVLHDEVKRIQERVASLPRVDHRSDEELIGYDETGLPR